MSELNYTSVEEMYRQLVQELTVYARNHLINQDNALDAVHEAFINVLTWQKRNPGKPINPKIVYGQVLRACRRINRHDPQMLSLDDPAHATLFRSV